MKISIINETYLVTNNTVICRIEYKVKFQKAKGYGTDLSYTSEGKATCKKGEKFDFNKGKKIALAKAEINAYHKQLQITKKYLNRYALFVLELSEFSSKAKSCIEHDNKYIAEQ